VYIEILVEDKSGMALLEQLLPKLLGEPGSPHTWKLRSYKGVGKIPPKLTGKSDPSKRILLDQLPRLLNGFGKSRSADAVVVIVDSDRRDCKTFLAELKDLLARCPTPPPVTMFRLAIEEVEAWYLGDREALLAAYPHAKKDVLKRYEQDRVCGTWELLADAIYPGGAKAVKDAGWPLPGQLKHEWAEEIGPHMDPGRNQSPSFRKLCDGLRRLAAG
jgi:Domain of unknown function (DUF4276)